MLGLCRGYIGYILGLYWGYIGYILGLYRGYIGYILGLYRGYIGYILGLYWGYIGYILGLGGKRFWAQGVGSRGSELLSYHASQYIDYLGRCMFCCSLGCPTAYLSYRFLELFSKEPRGTSEGFKHAVEYRPGCLSQHAGPVSEALLARSWGLSN